MIEVKNLTKRYGDRTVVSHLNFTIAPGKIYGFLGPNGAGKSTTMNMITGCLAPTEGVVLIDGHDICEDAVAAKRQIGYLPEIPPVYPDMTPEEYLRFVAGAKGIRASEIPDQVESAMRQTDITEVRDRLIKNLSKGYRQRVGIAQAMLGEPKLILLDEPTVGLDPRQILEIRELILRLGKSRTVILSSHILAEVSAVCDHVMIMRRGKLVASDTLENIRKNNMPENRVSVTVKATPAAVEPVLRGIPGILSYETKRDTEEKELTDLEIEVEPGQDIREKLFFAFAEKKMAVRKLARAELSLEEIFLRLTDDSEDYEEDGDGGEENGSGVSSSEEENEEEDEEDDEEDDYVPLFGKKTDGEDKK